MRCQCCVLFLFAFLQLVQCYEEDAGERTDSYSATTTNEQPSPPGVRNQAPVQWRYLGGEALSRPCCVSSGHGRVDCFIRGPKSSVLHRSVTKKEDGKREYSRWEDLGGAIIDEIECVSREPGIVDVLVLGTNNALFVNNYSPAGWSGWQSLAGALMEVPSCAVRDGNTINCLLRDARNVGYSIAWNRGTWSKFASVEGLLHDPIECSSRSPKHLNCFGAGTTGVMHQKYFFVGGGWGGWGSLGGSIKGRPTVTNWDVNRFDIFALGTDNAVWQKKYDITWFDWVSLGGVFDSAPECVTTGPDKIHCFAIGKGRKFYRDSWDGKAWSGWVEDYDSLGRFLETPSCVVSDADEVSCYVRNTNMGITQIVYNF